MSTLRQALAARDADAAAPDAPDAPCHAVAVQPPSLQVEANDGVRWILPWAQFCHGRHRATESDESLVLVFTQHEVVLRGNGLGALADAAASLRLELIRAWPGEYRAAAGLTPFIRQIQVRDVGEQPTESVGTSQGQRMRCSA